MLQSQITPQAQEVLGSEVLRGEAGPPHWCARGRPSAGAAQPAGCVAYAPEDGVQLLVLDLALDAEGELGLGIRVIWVIRFGLFGFYKIRVL